MGRRRVLLVFVALLLASAGLWGVAARGRRPRVARPSVLPAAAASVPRGGGTIAERFPVPAGSERVPVPPGSFGAYLRSLPLRPPGTPVRLHDGTAKRRQDVHAAVVDLDVGPRDLQQCADAVMRLRAEHLFSAGRAQEVAFHFTSGFLCTFARWGAGDRPRVEGNDVSWVHRAPPDASHDSLRRFLDVVFTYAGTRSLPQDLERALDEVVQPGDVFLQPGSPGHAMIVVDVASDGARRTMLLAQGYMPAQDIHVVRNLGGGGTDPWYACGRGDRLETPEWTFRWSDRSRFPARSP